MTPEERAFAAELQTPVGAEGSGRRRYAAAMALNQAGRLSDAALEVYRICSPRDHEDPAVLLALRGLAGELPPISAPAADIALVRLVDETDRYLASLSGPGLGETRAGLSAWTRAAPQPVDRLPNAVVDAWLPRALGLLAADRPALAAAIGDAAPHLTWITYDLYAPETIGEAFRLNHAFASLVGEEMAPFTAQDYDLGLFLIAPDVLYRDHRHAAPELYAPLTGPHGWRFGTGDPVTVLPAHAPVWNEPFRPHMTKVGSEPFLCIYAWTRDVNAPADVIMAADWPELEALRIGPAATAAQ
ncbi:dimethylsulfoniopropionate lyase [Defluviimonas sp. WL0002]|uniref:Dimethylsulfoniopropionate lyase n=1 Tax=Albidovulum marisflavi TaxID=2984159 RepID=A0ABT2Z9A5_9RHOB|nr:dimethylsulfoniopropionate lyase [Defluviimonas sp. WL0002]MCV2867728.1 dimethylsulfoniopropionate lyase [Defluviimonas sp. WL0002]